METELDRGGQEPERCPGVEPALVGHDSMERRPGRLRPQGIGELELATATRRQPVDLVPRVGGEHVATR